MYLDYLPHIQDHASPFQIALLLKEYNIDCAFSGYCSHVRSPLILRLEC